MENTLAKDVARSMFYNFVQRSFTKNELSTANILVLLGQERREIKILDHLGFARQNISCVENDSKVYRSLYQWNMREPEGKKIQLYFYELNDRLRFILDQKQNVEIFNLDIYGTIQNKILPQFKNVITLSNRQPKTVIGTYLSAGRDQHVLTSVLEPTVWLMMFDPIFKELIEDMVQKFIAIGHKKRVAFNHVLRIMQWVYSMLNIIVEVSHPKRAKVMSFNHIPEAFWNRTIFSQEPLTWGKLVSAVQKHSLSGKINNLQFDCAPTELQLVDYRSRNFTQLCQFMKMEQGQRTLRDIIETLAAGLKKFYYVDKEDQMKIASRTKEDFSIEDLILFDSDVQEKICVKIRARIDNASKEKVKRREQRSNKPKEKQWVKFTRRKKKVTAPETDIRELLPGNGVTLQSVEDIPPPKELWNQKDHFTEAGRNFIRSLAHQGQGTKQIAEYFPKATPITSIRAMVSISNRPRNKPSV